MAKAYWTFVAILDRYRATAVCERVYDDLMPRSWGRRTSSAMTVPR